MLRRTFLLAGVSAFAALASAQEGSITGPVPGYVFDAQDRALRPVIGIPGAAYLGDAVIAGLDAAAISPDGKLVIAARGDRVSLIRGLGTASLVEEQLAEGDAQAMAFSADSASAAVALSSGLLLYRSAELTRLDTPTGKLLALAVAGEQVLAGIEDAGVYLLRPGYAPRLLSPAARPVSLAISGKDAFFADPGRNRISVIRNFEDGGGAVDFAANTADAVGAGAAFLYAVDAQARLLRVYSAQSGAELRVIGLDFEPTSVSPLGAELFMLNTPGVSPLQLLDVSSQAVYFVPSNRAASN